MNPSTIFYFLLFLSFLPQQITSYRLSRRSNLIDKTCNQTRYKNLCKTVLTSNPWANTNNLENLTRTILLTATLNSTYIRDLIHEMMIKPKKTGKENVRCLGDCYNKYREATDQMEDSISAVDSKGYDDVRSRIRAAIKEADSCELGFRSETGHESPVWAMSRIFTRICNIGLTFANLLDRSQI